MTYIKEKSKLRLNLKATLEVTQGRIDKKFIAKSLGRSMAGVRNWYNDRNPIPEPTLTRLLEIFEANQVTPIWHKTLN